MDFMGFLIIMIFWMIITNEKYWTAAEVDKHKWILFIFFIFFQNGDTYIVKMSPLLNTRTEVQYWGPMVTENTFALLHIYNTCIVLKLFWLPITTHTALFFICNVSMLSPLLVSGHAFSDRTEMVVLLAKQIFLESFASSLRQWGSVEEAVWGWLENGWMSSCWL